MSYTRRILNAPDRQLAKMVILARKRLW